jgi:hypothetical protein
MIAKIDPHGAPVRRRSRPFRGEGVHPPESWGAVDPCRGVQELELQQPQDARHEKQAVCFMPHCYLPDCAAVCPLRSWHDNRLRESIYGGADYGHANKATASGRR